MDYTWIIIWACVIGIAVLIEVQSMMLVSSWFAGGAIVAIILAAIPGIGWEIQVIVFVAVSLGLLLAARPLAKKYIKYPLIPTNADVHLGKQFKLLADVTHGRSTVSINDVVWAVQVDGDCKAGDFVILKEISGNKYIASCASKNIQAETPEVAQGAKKKKEVK